MNPPAPPMKDDAAVGRCMFSNGRGAWGVPIGGNREGFRVYAPSGAWIVSGKSGIGTMGTAGTTGRGGGSRGRKEDGGGMYSSILVGGDAVGRGHEGSTRRDGSEGM
jgi:hypothetical protein